MKFVYLFPFLSSIEYQSLALQFLSTNLSFYQLLQWGTETTGIDKDKVVVIDDQISSLDRNVLFIVTTLVKNIM